MIKKYMAGTDIFVILFIDDRRAPTPLSIDSPSASKSTEVGSMVLDSDSIPEG